MINEFPKMLFKSGGPEHFHGGDFSILVVADEEHQASALKDGWSLTTSDAVNLDEKDDSAPTRAELEEKAKELNISFDGRTKDKKLGELIAAKLAKQ